MTSNKSGRIPNYIEHIIPAIGQIEKYLLGLNQTNFVENDMAQDSIIRQFEVIG